MIVNELASMSKELERIILFYAKAHKFSDEDGKKNLAILMINRFLNETMLRLKTNSRSMKVLL